MMPQMPLDGSGAGAGAGALAGDHCSQPSPFGVLVAERLHDQLQQLLIGGSGGGDVSSGASGGDSGDGSDSNDHQLMAQYNLAATVAGHYR